MNLIQVESMKRIILLVLCILLVTSAYGADTQKLYNKTVTSVVSLKVDTPRGGCIGSGFYALEPDIIVTCYHVVEGATNITAKTSKGNIVSIDGIIDYSQEKDIALLKASSKNSTFLELQANMPKPGTPAYVLGSPQGLDFSFSNGMVSQIRRGKETLIQFTCPVSSGNSGGPLLSEEGKVLGIVSCQLTEGQNLNFSVPSASLYMLNKDNAVTKIQNNNYVNNSNSSGLTPAESYNNANEHYNLGNQYLQACLYDDAVKEYLLALKYLPENLQIIESLTICFRSSRQYNYLKTTSEEGIKISLRNNDLSIIGYLYQNLADAYYFGYENDIKAKELYELIIDKYLDKKYWSSPSLESYNSSIGSVFGKLANIYLSRKEIRKAILYLEKSLKYKNADASTLYTLGLCYFLLKDYQTAQNYAESALKLNPYSKETQKLLEDCKILRRR